MTVIRRDSVASLICRIRAAQKLDADIGVVLDRFIADKSKPLWDDVSAWSADSKRSGPNGTGSSLEIK